MLRLPRVTVALAAGLLLATGCGGSSSPKPAAQVGANGQTSASSPSSQSTDGSSDSNNGGGGQVVAGDIVLGAYQSGSARVDISGGKSASIDFNSASGITQQGNTFITFTDGSSTSSLTLAMSKSDSEAGVAINSNGLTTGGQFGDKCSFDIKRNDTSELAGTFTCSGVDGVQGSTVFTENLNIKGTFSAKA